MANPSPGMVAPFIFLLVMIAIAPFIAPKFWSKHYHHVAFLLSLIVVIYYLAALHDGARMLTTLADYVSFVALIGSLFTIAGGIFIDLKVEPSSRNGVLYLFGGGVLANFVGTTGASMLLVRPFIKLFGSDMHPFRMVLFIFIVSNVGGLLTPLGDPPLFLGYIKGVPFFWLLQTWQIVGAWIVTMCWLLAAYFLLDYVVENMSLPCLSDKPLPSPTTTPITDIEINIDDQGNFTESAVSLTFPSGQTEDTLGQGSIAPSIVDEKQGKQQPVLLLINDLGEESRTEDIEVESFHEHDNDDKLANGKDSSQDRIITTDIDAVLASTEKQKSDMEDKRQDDHLMAPLSSNKESSSFTPMSVGDASMEQESLSQGDSKQPPEKVWLKALRRKLSPVIHYTFHTKYATFKGLHNFFWLGIIIMLVLLQESAPVRNLSNDPSFTTMGNGLSWTSEEAANFVTSFIFAISMTITATLSHLLASEYAEHANELSYEPLLEVIFLFFGIFATMTPALDILQNNASSIGFKVPRTFYWGSGALSSVLDNAPTYINFLAAAMGLRGLSVDSQSDVQLMTTDSSLMPFVIAISIGSVFFGSCTYIGNGPNMMVKSIAISRGVSMPTFFEYIYKYSIPVLMPIFVVVGFAFVS